MKRKSFLLFKNAVKQTLRNKTQLIALIILVLLSGTIFSLMTVTTNRIVREYDKLVQKSNLHDFIFDLNKTSTKDTKIDPKYKICDDDSKECHEQNVINSLMYDDSDKSNPKQMGIWDRVEARTFVLGNNNNTKIIKAIAYNQTPFLDPNTGEETNDLHRYIDRLIPDGDIGNYDTFRINDVSLEGVVPEEQRIVVNKEFAENNGIEIGSIIRLQPDIMGDSIIVKKHVDDPKAFFELNKEFNWFYVVNYGVSADFSTPIIDETTVLPNKKREGIVYVSPKQFGLTNTPPADKNALIATKNGVWEYSKRDEKLTITSNSDREVYYVGKYFSSSNDNNAFFSSIKKKLGDYYQSTTDLNDPLVYKVFDSHYRFAKRTSLLETTIAAYRTTLTLLLVVILIISAITIALITRKNIEYSKTQFGILKSLGYRLNQLLGSTIALPLIGSFIGCILVYIPSSFLQIAVVNIFSKYFNIYYGSFYIDVPSFFYCLLLTFGFLSVIATIVTLIVLLKRPIDLMKASMSTKVTKFGTFYKSLFVKRKFVTRFKVSIFTSSIGKMFSVALTMGLGTILMTMSVIGPKVVRDNKKMAYAGMHYNSITQYTQPLWNVPYTTYRTFNPNLKPWQNFDYNIVRGADRENEIINELYNGKINSEYYAPPISNSVETGAFISNLTWKQFTRGYLARLDSDPIFASPDMYSIILQTAWTEGLSTYTNIDDLFKEMRSVEDFKELAKNNARLNQIYNNFRDFYRSYRTTINMNVNEHYRKNASAGDSPTDIDYQDKLLNPNYSYNKQNYRNIASFADASVAGVSASWSDLFAPPDEYGHKFLLNNEKEFILNSSSEIADPMTKLKWVNRFVIWYQVIFNGRPGQGVVQGMYVKSPYFIRQNLGKAFLDKNNPFSVAFNVVPYDNENDELGTYISTSIHNRLFRGQKYNFNVFGLEKNSKLMTLLDEHNNNLNNLLNNYTNGNDVPNIVINKTIAKQMNLHPGDEIDLDINNNQLVYNSSKNADKKADSDVNSVSVIGLDSYDTENICMTPLGGTLTDEEVSNTSLGLKYLQLKQIPVEDPYKGIYDTGMLNTIPTLMQQAVRDGKIVISQMNAVQKVKVAGIYNGYGLPAAYISKSWADHLSKLDLTNEWQFNNIFKKEWAEKKEDFRVNVDGKTITFKMSDILKPDMTYRDLVEEATNNPDSKEAVVLRIFKNEFPIFNYKMSKSEEPADLKSSFSTSIEYGDFTQFALNGGSIAGSTEVWNAYGLGSVKTLMPLNSSKFVLDQVTAIIDTILIAFAILALLISFTIILVTSNLVIYENSRTIATMKVLGYSDAKIVNIVIGMYLPIIVIMFFAGFPLGWWTVSAILNYIAMNSTWVLPLFFVWWLPVVVGVIVLGIYAISFVVGWYSLRKINPIYALKVEDI